MSSKAPAFNLKAVIRETGLKPDTLRAWERRYGLPQPQRTSGGHRLYSPHDIDMLKWLIARQQEGLSISRAVDMWHALEADGKDPLQGAAQALPRSAWSGASLASGEAVSDLRRAWMAACLVYDERTAENTLAHAFALFPSEVVCFEVLQKGLAEIGAGWYRGEVTVQQEHFTSALAMRRLEALVAATPAPTRSGRILAACPPEEEHTFSLLLLTLLLRRQGWEVIYLGANVPLSRLEATLSQARPQLVVSSAQHLPVAATLREMGHLLQRERVPLAYGGRIFNAMPALRDRIPGHFLGEHLNQAPQAVQQIMNLSPRPPQAATTPDAYLHALVHYLERQPAIEAAVMETVESVDIPRPHLTVAHHFIERNIAAALELGDMGFAGDDIHWIEGLLLGQRIPVDQLRHYLRVYTKATTEHLDERGQLIVDWLERVTARE
jgi:DNA-binding transcriptional MerR regulator